MAGPDLPPLSAASRESSRRPPAAPLPWQLAQLSVRTGRTFFSKNSVWVGVGDGAADLRYDIGARVHEERQRPEGRQRNE